MKRSISKHDSGRVYFCFLLLLMVCYISCGSDPSSSPTLASSANQYEYAIQAASPPTQPKVTITPATPLESEFQTNYASFSLTCSASSKDPDGGKVRFKYQWYKNNKAISGATTKVLTAAQMGRQGHTIRGYKYKCQVTAIDNEGEKSTGQKTVTIAGPYLGMDIRGGRFSNFFRTFALNEQANPSISVMKKHINANWISIVILYFQDNKDSTVIYELKSLDSSVPSTIKESDLVSQIKYAHNHGLKVMLYPEIWINGAYGPGARNEISGSAEWFSAYQAKLLHLADIAQANGVELFCIGVELNATQDKEASWRALIAEVRKHYTGPLTYSCMYFQGIIDTLAWWDAVDYIGSSSLFQIPTGGTDMTLTDLTLQYVPYRDVIQNVSIAFGNKPVIITESCAYSLDGVTKWQSSTPSYSSTKDWQEQADYFEAMLETFYGQSWVVGFFVEDWIPTQENWYKDDPNWPTSTSFLNKWAEKTIKSWFTPTP